MSPRPGETSETTLASLTVEAALVLPLFLIFCGMLLSVFLSIQAQVTAIFSADREAQVLAESARIEEEIVVRRTVSGGLFPDQGISAVRKAWTGRFLTDEEEPRRFVIVTDHGSVYHLTETCTHLSLTVREVTVTVARMLRNRDGAKYYPCERCCRTGAEVCYITGTGRRYHTDRNCSGLKRNWKWVPLEDCELPACSRCKRE